MVYHVLNWFSISPWEHPAMENLNSEALTYMPRLTLNQMSSVKLITTLWSQKHIHDELISVARDFATDSTVLLPPKSKVWDILTCFVYCDLDRLNIPKSTYYILQPLVVHVGKSLNQWIIQMNHTLRWNRDSKHNSVKYLQYVVWTQYGTVSDEATARSMLTIDQLSQDDKFILACNYCLEEVYEIGSRILCNDDSKFKQIPFQNYPLVHYWMAVITNNYNILRREVDEFNRSYNRHFSQTKFLCMILTSFFPCNILNRRSAIEYVWNKLKIEEKVQYIQFFTCSDDHIELTFHFIHSLDLENRRKVLSAKYVDILKNLMQHCLWTNDFFKVFDLFSNMITLIEFLDLCRFAVQQVKSSKNAYWQEHYHRVYTKLWYNIPEKVESDLYSNPDWIATTLRIIPWDMDLKTVHKIISKTDESQRKNVITSRTGRKICAKFVKKNQWQFYDLFTQSLLPNKQDLFEFKKSLIEEHGLGLAVNFFNNRDWDTQEKEFFEWFFRPVDGTNDHNVKFFLRYFYKNQHSDLLNKYVEIALPDKLKFYELKRSLLNEEGFKFAECMIRNQGWEAEKDFFRWYFENETKTSRDNKKRMKTYLSIKLGNPLLDVCNLSYFINWTVEPTQDLHESLLSEDYLAMLKSIIIMIFIPKLNLMQADAALDWYFRGDSERIVNFKKSLIQKPFHIWFRFLSSLVERDPELHLLRNLLKWCSPDVEVMEKLKSHLLWSNICSVLLREDKFELADNFVNWCLDSCEEKTVEFKNNFMVGAEAINIFNEFFVDEEKLKKIFKWFNPNPTTISVLKSVFCEGGTICKLLTEMIEHPDTFKI